jgi:hypothetical protein
VFTIVPATTDLIWTRRLKILLEDHRAFASRLKPLQEHLRISSRWPWDRCVFDDPCMDSAEQCEAGHDRLPARASRLGWVLAAGVGVGCATGCSSKPTQRASLEFNALVIDPVATPFARGARGTRISRGAISSVPTE